MFVLVASVAISLLSIAYGFFNWILDTAIKRLGPLTPGMRMQAFTSVLVHLTWELLTVGSVLRAHRLGAARWFCLLALLFLGGLSIRLIFTGMGLGPKVVRAVVVLFAVPMAALDGALVLPLADASPHFWH